MYADILRELKSTCDPEQIGRVLKIVCDLQMQAFESGVVVGRRHPEAHMPRSVFDITADADKLALARQEGGR